MNIDTKTCRVCGEKKQKSEFNRAKGNSDGLKGKCKKCDSEYNKTLYSAAPDNKIEAVLEHREKNKEKYLKYQKDYRAGLKKDN